MFRPTLILSSILLFSACGGGSSAVSPVIVPPADSQIGSAGNAASYDPATDSYTFTIDGTTLGTTPMPLFDSGRFAAFAGDIDPDQGLLISRSDNAIAAIIAPLDGSGLESSVVVSRLTETAIPQSGRATLTGDYRAVVNSGGGTSIFILVDGDATLNVDFDRQSVDGTVTDRVARNIEDNSIYADIAYNDLILEPAPITATGAFSAATSGGELIFAGTPAGTLGQYSGLLAGPNATEAVMSVELDYNLGFAGALERGAIAVSN